MIRKILRRIYLETKLRADTIKIDDPILYERLQFRPGQLEYTHPREMIKSNIDFLLPHIDKLCDSLDINRSQLSILDAGARDGWTVESLCSLGFDAIGIELVSELVEHANNKGRKVDKGDVQNLPYENNTFNVVFCRHTLEHTTNPRLALSELVRVTKSFGLIFVSLPLESAAHGKHTAAIPNLRVLKSLQDGLHVEVMTLCRSTDTNMIIPDGDEALMIMRKKC